MSFRFKTILGQILIQVLVIGILIATSMTILRGATEQSISQRAKTTAKLFATLSKDSILSYDLATLETYANDLKNQEGVVYVRILDRNGMMLMEKGAKEILSKPFFQDHDVHQVDDGIYDAMAMVSEGETIFGQIQLGFDIKEITRTIQGAWQYISIISVLAVTVVALFSFFLGQYLTRQLTALMKASQILSEGDLNYRLPVGNKDELGKTAQAFNAMADKLSRLYTKVEGDQKRLRDIVNNSPSIIALKDASGHFLMVNRQFEQVFGMAEEAILGKTAGMVFPGEMASKIMEEDRHVIDHSMTTEQEISIPLESGLRTYIVARFPLISEEEGNYGVGCVLTDITDRKEAEDRLRLTQKIFENTSEAILVTDPQSRIVEVNDAYTAITGYDRHEIIGKNPNKFSSGLHDKAFYEEMWHRLRDQGLWSGEIWDRRKNGESFPKWLNINAIRNDQGETTHYVGIFSDISEKKAAEEKLESLAYYDPLTKLPNRTFFRERLEQEMAVSLRHDYRVALMFIDLDRFKNVNDTLGHDAGDELLIQVSERIQSCLRKTDTVARLGGDEFTVILTEVAHEEAAGHVAQNIIDSLQKAFNLSGNEAFIGASIGIGIYPDDGRDSEALIKNADTAMYHAKESGRGNFKFFRAEMNERTMRRVQLENKLRRALEHDQFVIHYQPKYALETNRPVGMEALVRWQHPDEGLISPGEFIPVAEETKLIIPIGEWVLKTACMQVKAWENEGLGLLRVAVNLSSHQFKPGLVEFVRQTLNEVGLPPDALELEITESIVMEDPKQAADLLLEIRDMGVHISIDDFGTGYSSLAYLKKFPIHALKIDQSFVRDLTEDSDDAAIVESVISMAKGLRIGVVAEGVETSDQRDFLKSRNCEEVQGYFFSKPLPPDEFASLLGAEE